MNKKILTHDERVKRDLRLVEGFSHERLMTFCQNATSGFNFGLRKSPAQMNTRELLALAHLLITS